MEKKKNTIQQVVTTSTTTRIIPNPYSDIAQLKNGKYQFDFKSSLNWLEAQGKKEFGSHFRLYREDRALIFDLLVYAIRDQETAQKRKLNLQKGILLTGPIGCGKTTLMTLTNYFTPPDQQYLLISSRSLGFEFEKDGFKVLNRYGKVGGPLHGDKQAKKVVCFDDLGVEKNAKYFGNECNVMAEILLTRYEAFTQKGTLTHVTTNLSATEIEQRYGNRVRSRMREMFNLIAFYKNARDKRS